MSLTAQEVAKLADLARIELSEVELAKFADQLDIILDSVAKVSQVASADIEPTSHPIPLCNVFREDECKASFEPADMLAAAPAQEDDMFKSPRILGLE